jgi:hypothetical protein
MLMPRPTALSGGLCFVLGFLAQRTRLATEPVSATRGAIDYLITRPHRPDRKKGRGEAFGLILESLDVSCVFLYPRRRGDSSSRLTWTPQGRTAVVARPQNE